MSSQTRKSERTMESVDLKSLSPSRTSQRKKRSTYKALQSTIFFALIAPSQLGQISTCREPSLALSTTEASTLRGPPVSPTPSKLSSCASSIATTHHKKGTVPTVKYVFFEVDFGFKSPHYKLRERGQRAIGYSRISWIYIHGIELQTDTANTGSVSTTTM
jgi:hypothetical protein